MNTNTQNKDKWRNYYQQKITDAGYNSDDAQLEIIDQFSRIDFELLNATPIKSSVGLLGRFFGKTEVAEDSVKGLYLYGTVGRGKTFLMDLFCEKVEHSVKRIHYHHFMKSVHEQLRNISDKQNPLEIVAKDFASKYRILCLDEFMVTDITDAMMLYGLLKHLTDNGVAIVTTSNIVPDDLYKNGLQREQFLPAIDIIKNRCIVHQMGGEQDFRRLKLNQQERFFTPLNDKVHKQLDELFEDLNFHHRIVRNDEISINDRDISFIAKSEDAIWFDFEVLCEGFRSQLDYIELAKKFSLFFLTNIPVLDTMKEDAAKRFLLLIDELYERQAILVLSSEVPITEIYTGKRIAFEFDRLQSRLFEMQSEDYGK